MVSPDQVTACGPDDISDPRNVNIRIRQFLYDAFGICPRGQPVHGVLVDVGLVQLVQPDNYLSRSQYVL